MSGLGRVLRALTRRVVIAFPITATVMVGLVVFANYFIDRKIDKIERVDVEETVKPATEVLNFLLIGSDTRGFVETDEERTSFGSGSGDEGGGQRSDTLMVVHLDPKHKKAVVVSFPRDLWVTIPGVGKSKINAAFNSGPDVVIQTLKDNFNVDINHYIEIDFKTFQGMVNAVGTVPVYFPYPTRDDKTGLYVPIAGCQQLDGKAALAYVRARHLKYFSYPQADWYDAAASADLARIKRQQDFMKRLASLAAQRSLNNPLTANEVVDEMLKNLKVDAGLQKDALLSLISVFSKVDPNDSSHVRFETIETRLGTAGRLSVLYLHDPEASDTLAELRGNSGTSTTSSSETTQTTAGATGPTTAPTTTTTLLTPVPITNLDELGPPAEKTASC